MDTDKTNEKDDAAELDSKNFNNQGPAGLGCRHQQCLLLFLAATVAYSLRSCMAVALVAMTAPPHDTLNMTGNLTEFARANTSESWNSTDDMAADGILHKLLFAKPYPVFRWSKRAQATVQAAFYWGYMLLQLPAGALAHRLGCRAMLVGCMLANGALFFVLPWLACYGGWVPVAACRCMQGLCQSCLFPSCHTFLGKWAPLRERSRMTAVIYGGTALGTVLGLPLTGFLAASSWGWPGVFRVYGALALMTGALLGRLADTPAQHPRISPAERLYIQRELGDGTVKLAVPWREIVRSAGVGAVVAAHVGQTWGQLTIFTEVPSYMSSVLGVNIKTNGLLTALPFFIMFLSNIAFSHACDQLIARERLSVTNTRKLANSVACVAAAAGLVMLGYAPRNIWVVEALLIFICAFKIAANMGFQTISIDMAPNFSGTLMSISNFVANGIGSFAPLVSGLILKDDSSNQARWRQVFLLVAGVYLASNLVFVLFATGERQRWNEPASEPAPGRELQVMLTDHTCRGHNEETQRRTSASY